MQRELSVGVATQVSGRAFFGFLALAVYTALQHRGGAVRAFREVGPAGLAIAVLLAISSGCFMVALNYASVANVLFMQALAPMMAALLATMLGEFPPVRTWFTIAIAATGVTVMVGGPGRSSPLGLMLSFCVAVSFAGVLVLSRYRRDVSMLPATCLSQLIILLATLPFAAPGSADGRDVILFVLLGVTQIGLGLVFLTIGGRLIPAAEVALISLLEIVLGPLWVWIFLAERPAVSTIVGGVIILLSVVVQTWPQPAPAPI